MIANMEWYRVFYMVARTGNVTKAAEALFITQPAVSHVLKQLEAQLQCQLFSRSSRGVTLTAQGEILMNHIGQAYHLMEAGERRLAELNRLEAGEVRIGAGDTLCRHMLLPYLERFHEDFPGIRIRVTNRTTPETLALLREGRIDFGLVHLPVQERGIDIRPCLSIQDCFVAGKRYAHLAEGAPLTWEALAQHPLILLEEETRTRRSIDQQAASLGLSLQPDFELGSIDLLVQFARIGLGVSCVVRDFVQEELHSGVLYEIPLDPPLLPRQIGVATLQQVPLPPAAGRFLERLPGWGS